MRIAFERQALRIFDELLNRPEAERGPWLHRTAGGDPGLMQAVMALVAADSRSAALPTMPPAQSEPAPPDPPPERLGNYRLIRELGRGGMGIVYLGERADGLFEQQVAVKLIRHRVTPRSAGAFEAERRHLARIEHPHVARLIDGGVAADGRPWLATEYVAGATIDVGSADRPLAATLRLFLQAAQAVQFAHGRLVAHGDVKPANILVGEEDRVKLLDFGIARLIGGDALPVEGSFTPGFASPTRLVGAPPSVADDVFALGRTLAAITPAAADRELAAVIARATAPEPARYPSAQAMIADVESWLGGRPVAAMAGGLVYHARKFVQRHLVGVAAAALALAALAGSALVAEHNYRLAERARAGEALRFADAHRAAHYLMFTLLDRLEHRPGMLRLRIQVGNVAQTYLDRLAASPDAPSDVRLDVAQGYLRAAVMAGMGNAPNLGDVDRADRDLLQASAMLEALRRERPTWPLLAQPLARVAWLTCQKQIYANHDASRALAEARAGIRELATVVADPAQRAVVVWPVRICAGDALVWLDRTREATAVLEHDLAAARTRRPLDREMIERNLRLLGEAYFYARRYPDAERVLEEAAAIQTVAHARAPFFGPAVIEAANVADDLASAYGAERRYRDQLRVARAALTLVERQASLDRDDVQSARRALSISRLVAGALGQLGRPGEAAALMTRTGAGWDALQRRFPDDATTARLRLLAVGVTAGLQRQGGLDAAACATDAEAARGWATFGRRWRLSPSDRDESVIPVERDLAACTRRAGG